MAADVPFAPPSITEADVAAVTAVLRSGWLTTGEECLALEQELASYTGAAHVVAVSSATAALELAYLWLDLPPGARVGVPAWTFVASALAPMKGGAHIVLLDSDPDTLNVAPESVEAALAAGLDALVPVHFGGVPVAPEIRDLCAARGVPVIEDAAHALGARDDRGPVCGRGTVAAAFSFYATKNLTSAEGGALATDDGALAEWARAMRLHGLSGDAWARYRPDGPAEYDLVGNGLKANLPDVLAALARSQLARFDALQARRREAARRYRELLAEAPGVRCVPADLDPGGADHLMVVVLPEGTDRDRLRGALRDAGIGTSVHFRPLHHFRWLHERCEVSAAGLPVCDELAARALSLPLHPALSDADVERVCRALTTALAP